jgi:branched-subunit amino acid ABC-type transport system permease component
MVKRVSGVAIASVAAILAATGYALYYTTDRLHDLAAAAHEVLGGAAILLALVHWRPHRRARRSRLLPG